MGDQGFGPVERGGGGSRRADAPVRPLPPGQRRPAPADDGFGPTVGGRAVRGGSERARDGGPVQRPAPPAPPRRPPAAPPVAHRRRRRSPFRTLLLVLLLAVALVLAGGVGLAAYASGRVERIPVQGLSSAGTRMNILVVGSDSREGLTDEQVAELGTGRVEGKRTDTIFLLSVEGQRAAMLSFPRDLYVTRCDGSQGRINSAFTTADGPSCLVQTVSQLSGLPVSHYMEVSFLGFRDIVDAVGGVSVYLDAPISDAAAAIDLPAGCNHLDGRQALGFVRVRSIDNDLGRIARQQYFLQQLAREAAAPSTFLNPLRLVPTTGAVGDALVADEGFGAVDFVRLGLGGRGLARGGLPTFTVPATPASVGGAAVLMPDEAAASSLFARFRDGSVLDAAAPAGQAAGGLQLGAVGLHRLLSQPAHPQDPAAQTC